MRMDFFIQLMETVTSMKL